MGIIIDGTNDLKRYMPVKHAYHFVNGVADPITAPSQSVLQRWLREVHNLIVVVKPYYGKEVVYGYIIYQEAEGCIKRIEDGIVDRSYESTLEVAEQKCLTLIIEKQ